MNRINPVYVLIGLFIIAFLSFVMVSSKKSEFERETQSLFTFKQKAKVYSDLSENWNNADKIKDTLNKVLNNSKFKQLNISRVDKDNSIKIKFSTKDPRIVDSFVNKILNEKLQIKRLDVTLFDVSLEIGVI